jgi:chemosensory pili system protein ChpA (sensor histidine kinase/response regulator)
MQAELSRTIKEHVYREIDASLRDARYALEAYLDENSEGTELSQCVSLIEQVDGAVAVLQHKSLSLLSKSLLELALKLKSDGVDYPELALELLIKGMGVIPNYLYLLDSGVEEYDNFFVPLVNDINQLLGKTYIFDDLADLSEQLPSDIGLGDKDATTLDEDVRQFFQIKRPEFLKALLGLYKSSDLNVKDLFPLINILDEFSEKTAGTILGEYFLISRNIIENIKGQDDDSIRSSKILMGRIDKLVKHLIDPESKLDNQEIEELGRRLFYKLITVNVSSPEIQEIKNKYHITDDLAPHLDKIGMYRDFVSGPNTESYETIAHTLCKSRVYANR